MQDGSLRDPKTGKELECEGPELFGPPPFPVDTSCPSIIYKFCPDGSVIEHFYNSGRTPGGTCVYTFIRDCPVDNPAVAAPEPSCCEIKGETFTFGGVLVEDGKHGVQYKWDVDMVRVGERVEWRDPAEDPLLEGFSKCDVSAEEIIESGTRPGGYRAWGKFHWNSVVHHPVGEAMLDSWDRGQHILAAGKFGAMTGTLHDFPNITPRWFESPTMDDRVLIFWKVESGCRDYNCCVLILIDYSRFPFGVRRRGPVCGRHCRFPNVILKTVHHYVSNVRVPVTRVDVKKMFDVMGAHMGPTIVDVP